MYKVLNDLAPNALVNLFMRKSNVTDYELRGSSTSLQTPFPRTENINLKICVIWLLCQYLKVELVITISRNIM